MIERSITQYLANHDRRREPAPSEPVWSSPLSGAASTGRPMLDMAGLDIEDVVPDAPEAEYDAPAQSMFVPFMGDTPDPVFEPFTPEHSHETAEPSQGLFETQVRAARENWILAESELLHDRIVSAFAEIETCIADQVARILQPFVLDSMKQLAVEALIHRMDAVLSGENGPILRICGPEDLLAALHIRLKERAAAFSCIVAPVAELQAMAGSLRMETSLSEWLNAVRAATGVEGTGETFEREGNP